MADVAVLCPVDDIPDGQMRSKVLPNGIMVALYNVKGTIYATDDLCTHGEASLTEEGLLRGREVECGFHFGCFDVITGEPTASPCDVALKTYPVRIVNGIVHVEVFDTTAD